MLPYISYNEYGVPVFNVDNEPYFILGGELHNSSASSLDYLEENVWPYLRNLNLNTVLLTVAWEDFEPYEGRFNTSLLQGILTQARRENKKLILLWFGLWKNSESYYAPSWVKSDRERFFRACLFDSSKSNIVSPFCEEALEKDRNAFCHLMRWLSENDKENTVIMVQIENEMGILGADRDYCEKANEAFEGSVPLEMLEFADNPNRLSWKDAFSSDRAPEYFMAYTYAKAMEKMASAGKEIYPLPIFVNAWIEQHPDYPGAYPSGGPVAKVMDVWKKCAPSIDLFAPDIYLPDFASVCEEYSKLDNPLFIPETGRNASSATKALFAFAGANAIGFSPFGIEDICKNRTDSMSDEQLKELNIQADSFYDKTTEPYLKKSYEIIENIKEILVYDRGKNNIFAFLRKNPYDMGLIVHCDNFDIQLDYFDGKQGSPVSGGFIIKEENGFYIVGSNVKFTVLPKVGSRKQIGLLHYEEGEFINSRWKKGRTLNGDEIYGNSLGDIPECKYVRVF